MVTVLARKAEPRPYRALGERLAEARRLAGITSQRKAVEQLDVVSEGYLPAIERGTRRPDPTILRRLAEVYGVRYEELAELAGYLPRRRGDVTVTMTPEEANAVAQFLRISPEWRAYGVQAAKLAEQIAALGKRLSPIEIEERREEAADGPDSATEEEGGQQPEN